MSSSLVRDAIDAATDGLIAAFGASVLNACPHAATRMGTLRCAGCSWDDAERTAPLDSCALENVVGVQNDTVQSNYLFLAIVIAGIFAIFVIPSRDPANESVDAELGEDGR